MRSRLNERTGVSRRSNGTNRNDSSSPTTTKLIELQNMIKRTILAVQRYKAMDIFGASELSVCVQSLEHNFAVLHDLRQNNVPFETAMSQLQEVVSELSSLFRSFGTDSIRDLVDVCLGAEYTRTHLEHPDISAKHALMQEHVHPIGYKVMAWKNDGTIGGQGGPLRKNRIVEDFMIVESASNLECFDLARTSKSFQTKVFGVKFALQNPEQRRTLIVCGVVDDLLLSCLDSEFVKERLQSLRSSRPNDPDFESDSFDRFVESLTLKEILVYDNSELYNRYIGCINQVALIKQKTVSQVTKEFIANELYGQRTTLIQLLLKADEHEYQYLAYLLYDLLSNDVNGNVDTAEQTLLFDSLPWSVKRYFRDAMKQTVTYTNNLANFDNTKVPLEQQICLMKAEDSVKEKAMQKLKEVKSKSDDSGSKARQFLEGLLRIPFGIYREEPVLRIMPECIGTFTELVNTLNATSFPIKAFPVKDSYTSMEVRKYSELLKTDQCTAVREQLVNIVKAGLTNVKREALVANICIVNNVIRARGLQYKKLLHSGRRTEYMKTALIDFIDFVQLNSDILVEIGAAVGACSDNTDVLSLLANGVAEVETKSGAITSYMKNVSQTLDDAVHGHDTAKRQIERIIGQWINGEKTGYCFGFEGPPGVGKTSLAKKGIADCLKDDEGESRPFAFIAIGGSSNGSTLDGHNYTYVGSTWGRIAEILMEKKCMNPIIFIDELDKVSRTEHGREIIGILTHLIDPTQNDVFEDKYFSGIDLDLSKALFIFSYNDVDAIDRVLLDRIHRIKFKHLSLEDKLTVAKNFLLPEIYSKMGLDNVINISDDVVEYVIEEYTAEPGVRKLKELLFEIVGEINLAILRNSTDYSIPTVVTKEDVKNIYLKERHSIRVTEVPNTPRIGIVNGLWANALGKGGVLPVEAHTYPSGTFLDMKLTGMQGDVMKESMAVAKTLAWKLLGSWTANELAKVMDETKLQGIHIHVPEGGTPKDGPSGGTAITVALYSLLSERAVRGDVAMTGEICLQGKVLAIGGLDLKILGGIRAGVKRFIYPKENDKDFKDFHDKYAGKPILDGIEFFEVETIADVLPLVLVDDK